MTVTLPRLDGLEFALVGPGRVGSSLTLWLVARGATCRSVAGRPGSARARELADRCGARLGSAADPVPLEARLLLLTVPDAEIHEAARRIAGPRRRGVALHASGALGASVLSPLAASGYRVGAFHPLRAFPSVEENPDAAAGTFFALDGDPEARALGRRLAEALGGESAVVPEPLRPLYHWAGTMAAGGVVTMLATATSVARRLNLPEAAVRGYGKLAVDALASAIAIEAPAAAITGPAARGDIETVEAHLQALAANAPDLLPLAFALVRAMLDRCADAGAESPAQKALAERLKRSDLLDRLKDRVLTSTVQKPP